MMEHELTPEQTTEAARLWRNLMALEPDARDELDAAPVAIRRAIRAASAQVCASGDEPEASDANPFEVEAI